MKRITAFIAAALVAGVASAQQPQHALMFGHQNFDTSATELYSEFEGLTNLLAKALKQPVRFESVKKVDAYLQRAADHRYVLIFAPPSMVAEAVKHGGYEPIAKIPGRLAPAFMAMTRSQIAFLEDMKGKRLGTTDKDSMMTKLGMLHLRKQGIDPDKYFSEVRHFADVNAVIFALANNMIDVGLANTTLYNVWTNQGFDLTLIEQGPGAPHLTFAVRGDLPESEKRAILQVLLGATKDPDASIYFRRTGFPGVEPASMKDYTDLVKRLDIK
jgi:ABC-type phosphate/phosphonate transport system substrate-binding protein